MSSYRKNTDPPPAFPSSPSLPSFLSPSSQELLNSLNSAGRHWVPSLTGKSVVPVAFQSSKRNTLKPNLCQTWNSKPNLTLRLSYYRCFCWHMCINTYCLVVQIIFTISPWCDCFDHKSILLSPSTLENNDLNIKIGLIKNWAEFHI